MWRNKTSRLLCPHSDCWSGAEMQIRHRYFPVLDPTQGRPGRCYLLFFVYLFPRGRRYTYTDVHITLLYVFFFFSLIVAWHCILHKRKEELSLLFLENILNPWHHTSQCARTCRSTYCIHISTDKMRSQSSGFTFIGCLLLTWGSGQCAQKEHFVLR